MLRLSGVLFLLAAVAFIFTSVRWMAAIEVILAVAMFMAAAREGQTR
jgi:uncharacterized membrane protein